MQVCAGGIGDGGDDFGFPRRGRGTEDPVGSLPGDVEVVVVDVAGQGIGFGVGGGEGPGEEGVEDFLVGYAEGFEGGGVEVLVDVGVGFIDEGFNFLGAA